MSDYIGEPLGSTPYTEYYTGKSFKLCQTTVVFFLDASGNKRSKSRNVW